nr:MAG TPA: hypothetical protein [Caudoviricetes sp.]
MQKRKILHIGMHGLKLHYKQENQMLLEGNLLNNTIGKHTTKRMVLKQRV